MLCWYVEVTEMLLGLPWWSECLDTSIVAYMHSHFSPEATDLKGAGAQEALTALVQLLETFGCHQ